MTETGIESREELESAIRQRLEGLLIDPDRFNIDKIADGIENIEGGYPIEVDALENPSTNLPTEES